MRESTLWLLHLLCGAVMLVVLGIHFGVMHVGGLFGVSHAEVLDFASVSARSKMPFYLVVYLILLPAGLYHGLYGLRSIVYEVTMLGPVIQRVLNVLFIISGWGLFAYGAYAIIAGYLG
jgi:succinate dehydrogenase hydrophobic anchor subunit